MQHYDIEIFNELDQTFEEEFFKYGNFVSFKKKETPFLGDELVQLEILFFIRYLLYSK